MIRGEYHFSPLAEVQLDALWDYGFRRFGERQADRYLDGLFSAVEEVAVNGRYLGLIPKRVPPDKIAEITRLPIRYIRYEKHYLYLRDLMNGAIGVVCILGDRMDTPQRLQENLFSPMSEIDDD